MELIRTELQQRLEQKYGPLPKHMMDWWAEEMKHGKTPSTDDLAAHLAVHPQTLRRWFDDYGLRVTTSYVLEPIPATSSAEA